MAEQPGTPQLALAELVRSLGTKDLERHVLERTIDRARQSDPELAELLRACAVPRWFDVQIVGILRGRPSDTARNQRLLEQLAKHSFVTRRSEHRFAYHDTVRDMLLEAWQADEADRDRFDQLNQELAEFHEARHERARELQQHLADVADLVGEASLARYLQIAAAVDEQLIQPLLEALYHQMLRSAEAGYEFFIDHYIRSEATSTGRLTRALLEATSDYLGKLHPESTWTFPWLRYWEAREALATNDNERAERLFSSLLEDVGDDTKLRMWALSDLGTALQRQSKLDEAASCFEEELRLAEETQSDPYNLAVSYNLLGSLHWERDDLQKALACYDRAIESAGQHENLQAEIIVRLNRSGVLSDAGQRKAALQAVLEARHLARTGLAHNRGVQLAVSQQCMELISLHDHRLLDTLYQEATALLPPGGDPQAAFELRETYVRLLQQSGQPQRARAELDLLQAAGRDYEETALGTKLLLREAAVCSDEGLQADAVVAYDMVLERGRHGVASTWDMATALTSRGIEACRQGQLEQAALNLEAGRDQWRSVGNERLAALAQVRLADVSRHLGDHAGAAGMLKEAEASLREVPSYRVSWLRAQAGLDQARGRWREARARLVQASELAQALEDGREVVETLAELVQVAGRQGDWDAVAAHGRELAAWSRRLAEASSYQPAPAAVRANTENARGVRLASDEAAGQRRTVVVDAIREACRLVPKHFWYWLNLSYAYADLAEWGEAALAVERAAERAPEWLPANTFFQHRLVEYRRQQAEALFEAGRYVEAADAFQRVRDAATGTPELAADPVELLLRLGDAQLRARRPKEAAATYEQGLDAAGQPGHHLSDVLTGRLVAACAAQGDLVAGVERLRQRLTAPAGDPMERVAELVEACFSECTSIGDFHCVAAIVRLAAGERGLAPGQREALVAAALSATGSRYRRLLRPALDRVGTRSGGDLPMALPIVLEADTDLFPEAGETPLARELLDEALPDMRERLLAETGLRIPGVRLRVSPDLTAGRYLIMVHEAPLAGGWVMAERHFCPDPARAHAAGLDGVPGADAFGRGGLWLDDRGAQRALVLGIAVWRPSEFLARQLTGVLRRELPQLVGVQEVVDLLEAWERDTPEAGGIRAIAVPDRAALLRLVGVLRSLLRERLPVRDLGPLLAAFAAASSTTTDAVELAERVRAALWTEPPGGLGRGRRLDPRVEEAIAGRLRQDGGKRFLALPPGGTSELVGLLLAATAGLPDGDVLEVVRPVVRPFVRKLLEPTLADVAVVTAGPARAKGESR